MEFIVLYASFAFVRLLMDPEKSWHADGLMICTIVSIGIIWAALRSVLPSSISIVLPVAFGAGMAVASRYAHDISQRLSEINERQDAPALSHLDACRRLRSMARSAAFDEIIQRAALDPVDDKIMRMHYGEKHAFAYIGDALGYSEGGIKKRHEKAIIRIVPHLG